MTPEFTIFISSKMQELAEERNLLYELLPQLGKGLVSLKPWSFEEDALASSDSIRQTFLDALQGSSLYVGLFWNEYGEWTIDEFEHAQKWNIDRLIYVKDVEAQKRESKLAEFLGKHGDVVHGVTAKWFESLEELAEGVEKAIDRWLQNYLLRRSGSVNALYLKTEADLTDLPFSKLIGRKPLLEKILRNLNKKRSRILLQGFSGMGKTALAAATTAHCIRAGKGPVLWLRIGNEKTDTIFELIVRILGEEKALTHISLQEKLEIVEKTLTESDIKLLVLDDAWNDKTLSEVLKVIPQNLPVLVTSRQRHDIETILEVGELLPNEALELLNYHAKAKPKYKPDSTAMTLCSWLGYHAFALEIAGKTLRVSGIHPQSLIQKMKHLPPDVLALPEGSQKEEGRSNIREMLAVSLVMLQDQDRNVFSALGSLFAPNTTAEMLALTLGFGKDKDGITEAALITLHQQGLIKQATRSNIVYYHLHDLAHSYAKDLYRQKKNTDPHVAIRAGLAYLKNHTAEIPHLDVERDNILGAAKAALGAKQTEVLIEIMDLLAVQGPYFAVRGYSLEAIPLLEEAIRLTKDQGDLEKAHYFLARLGNYYANASDKSDALEAAFAAYQESLNLAQKLKNTYRESILLTVTGTVRRRQGRDDEESYYDRAQEIALELKRQGDYALNMVLEHRGHKARLSGDYEAARSLFAESLEAAERLQNDDRRYFGLLNLGTVECVLGNPTIALSYHQQVERLAHKYDNGIWKGQAAQALGEDYHTLGRRERAQTYFEQALEQYQANNAKTDLNIVIDFMNTHHYPIKSDYLKRSNEQ